MSFSPPLWYRVRRGLRGGSTLTTLGRSSEELAFDAYRRSLLAMRVSRRESDTAELSNLRRVVVLLLMLPLRDSDDCVGCWWCWVDRWEVVRVGDGRGRLSLEEADETVGNIECNENLS